MADAGYRTPEEIAFEARDPTSQTNPKSKFQMLKPGTTNEAEIIYFTRA
jgi:hypothetical protein